MSVRKKLTTTLFQERMPYNFQNLVNEGTENVFIRDEYLYGIRARVNAGFGLWQLAFGSKAALNAQNYAAARQSMMALKSNEGRPLGIVPNKLVVGPLLEQSALKLVNSQLVNTDGVSVSNEWAGTVEIIVVPWLA